MALEKIIQDALEFVATIGDTDAATLATELNCSEELAAEILERLEY